MDLDVEITAEPAALRSAIDDLGRRERAALRRIRRAGGEVRGPVIDVRDEISSASVTHA